MRLNPSIAYRKNSLELLIMVELNYFFIYIHIKLDLKEHYIRMKKGKLEKNQLERGKSDEENENNGWEYCSGTYFICFY